jgi:hypothetical protein
MMPQRLGFLFAFLPLALDAQAVRERVAVPLNNWHVPHKLQRQQLPERAAVAAASLGPKIGIIPPPPVETVQTLVFVPVEPCRLADTRPGSGYPALGSVPLASLMPATLAISGSCGAPAVLNGAGPAAYSLNITVVPPEATPGGYLVAYPNPSMPIPLAASLTWNPNASYQTNAVIGAASADGSVNIAVNNSTDVVIDINGYYAAPTDSQHNTSLGLFALENNEENTGTNPQPNSDANTAVGYTALGGNTTGGSNTGVGYNALLTNSAGINNTAVGVVALVSTTGSNNTAVGYGAGSIITSGNDNIMIGAEGDAGDDFVIRIGDGQTATFIAGISGAAVAGGVAVVINSSGQLGTEVSSRRFKDDIEDMGDASDRLFRLRPVSFRYKQPLDDGSKPLQYGLVAEEVAEVYPELVVRGKDGQVEGVQYQKLPVLLLSELQKQYRHAEEQDRLAKQQAKTIQELETRLAALESRSNDAAAKPNPNTISPAGR